MARVSTYDSVRSSLVMGDRPVKRTKSFFDSGLQFSRELR